MNLGIAMLPACVLGYLCHGMIKQYLFGPKTVIIGLVIGGLFMIFAEKKRKYFLVENIDQITSQQAFKIGLFFNVFLCGRGFPEAEALLPEVF